MKGKIIIFLTAVMCLLSACGASGNTDKTPATEQSSTAISAENSKISKEKSLLSPVGVYYGDIYSNQAGSCYSDQNLDGYKDCIVVFDYTNDAENRTMPESSLEPGRLYTSGFTCSEVTLKLNETNTYEAYDPNGYVHHYSNALNRYTSYKNPIGYGNLLGGADPVRMYAVFYVNPAELAEDTEAVLTVEDQDMEFDFSNIKEITYPDEILTSESNYEEVQQIAEYGYFLWQC